MGKKIKELEERIDVIEKNLSKLQGERKCDIRFSSMEEGSEESVQKKNLGSNRLGENAIGLGKVVAIEFSQ